MRVRNRQLDDSFAQFVVESRQRETEHLEAQRINRIKLISTTYSAINIRPSTEGDVTMAAD
jgi:putative heme iron utilization protein